MGKNAVYIAIDDSSLDALWQLGDQPFRDRFVEIEESGTFARLDIGKIWDALHCTLTGVSASNPIEGDKRSEAIVGVHPKIYDDEDYCVFVSVIDNTEIDSILVAIEELDSAKLSELFDPAVWKRKKIYPRGIWDDDPAGLLVEMDNAIRSICKFFRDAQASKKHILATIL